MYDRVIAFACPIILQRPVKSFSRDFGRGARLVRRLQLPGTYGSTMTAPTLHAARDAACACNSQARSRRAGRGGPHAKRGCPSSRTECCAVQHCPARTPPRRTSERETERGAQPHARPGRVVVAPQPRRAAVSVLPPQMRRSGWAGGRRMAAVAAAPQLSRPPPRPHQRRPGGADGHRGCARRRCPAPHPSEQAARRPRCCWQRVRGGEAVRLHGR